MGPSLRIMSGRGRRKAPSRPARRCLISPEVTENTFRQYLSVQIETQARLQTDDMGNPDRANGRLAKIRIISTARVKYRQRAALKMVTPARFERATFPLGGGRSIQLSYGATEGVKDTGKRGASSTSGRLLATHPRQRQVPYAPPSPATSDMDASSVGHPLPTR